MDKLRNFIAFFLLCTYTFVLLHSFIPHSHFNDNHVSDVLVSEHGHHHHSHDHQHHGHDGSSTDVTNLLDDQSHPDDGLLHSLFHLFDEFHHFDVEKNHLAHVKTVNNSPAIKFKITATPSVLRPWLLQTLNSKKVQKVPDYILHCNKRLLSSALSLRAPPVFS